MRNKLFNNTVKYHAAKQMNNYHSQTFFFKVHKARC